ncbi:MAG: hypothetical protein HQL11_03480 [Candidatus Omnitrophica bacterium]|nr:hypothetical protein [Candidatus Omnitrophota bacterium]
MDQGLMAAFFLYVLSFLGSVSSVRAETRYAVRVSRALFLAGTFLVLMLGVRGLAFRGQAPVSWGLETVFGCLVAAGFVSLVLRRGQKGGAQSLVMPGAGLFLCFAAILIRAFSYGSSGGDPNAVRSAVLFHVYFFVIALAALSVSFFFSALFLYQDALIRRKRFPSWMKFFPPLELTSRINFSSLTTGTAGLLAGTVIGVVDIGGQTSRWTLLKDPMVLVSLTVLVALRVSRVRRERLCALLSLTAYAATLIALVLSGSMGGGVH